MSDYLNELKQALFALRTEEKAQASRRYFPAGIHCLGVTAGDISQVIKQFQKQHVELGAERTLALSEVLLAQAKYSEEKLLAFGLLNKFVAKHYDDNLLSRFEFWLEHYADNWSLVDDLCIKTIYRFMLARPHLIEQTAHWAYSEVSWCRRASNVVWVKFIERKMGKTTYRLDTDLVFKQCRLLISDPDEFVQKSIGWLLKVTAVHHQSLVINFIEQHIDILQRATLRYAIEKMPPATRQQLLAIKV